MCDFHWAMADFVDRRRGEASNAMTKSKWRSTLGAADVVEFCTKRGFLSMCGSLLWHLRCARHDRMTQRQRWLSFELLPGLALAFGPKEQATSKPSDTRGQKKYAIGAQMTRRNCRAFWVQKSLKSVANSLAKADSRPFLC